MWGGADMENWKWMKRDISFHPRFMWDLRWKVWRAFISFEGDLYKRQKVIICLVLAGWDRSRFLRSSVGGGRLLLLYILVFVSLKSASWKSLIEYLQSQVVDMVKEVSGIGQLYKKFFFFRKILIHWIIKFRNRTEMHVIAVRFSGTVLVHLL